MDDSCLADPIADYDRGQTYVHVSCLVFVFRFSTAPSVWKNYLILRASGGKNIIVVVIETLSRKDKPEGGLRFLQPPTCNKK